jgi:hypothetical protein
MSTLSGGPNIVTNGLVLYLDAANRYSYISGSTAWNDLSRGGNNGTLVGSPTYSSVKGGSIVFNGNVSSAYVTTPSTLTLSNTLSFNFWVLSTGQTTYHQTILGKDNNSGGVPHLLIRRGANSDNLIWNYYTGVFTDNDTYTNLFTGYDNLFLNIQITVNYNTGAINVYKNGIFFGSSAPTMLYPSTSAILTMGNWLPNTGLPFNGNIAVSQIYNRVLSSTEVLQNYNALKSRFNLN